MFDITILTIIFLFSLGAITASFVGVLVSRFNTGQGFITGRSRCDSCNSYLHPTVLLPIFSFIFQGGRASCCGSRLSIQSPISEFLLGILFVFSYLLIDFNIGFLAMLVSLSALLALVLYDLVHQILPPIFLSIFVTVAVITGFLLSKSTEIFFSSLITALCLSLFLALIHVFSKGRAMGLADAPLTFGLAVLSGPFAFSGFVFSFWIGAIIGIIILLARRPHGSKMNNEVPFAPFLAAGFLLAYFTQWNPFAFIMVLL